jgi:ribose 5-phosphate isomerase B
MPARFIPFETVLEITDAWLDEEFEGGRHQGRLDKMCCCCK